MYNYFRDSVARDFSKASIKYDIYALLQREVATDLFTILKDYITESSLILDIGCGTGYLNELLRKGRLYNSLAQIDIAFGMCKIAKSYEPLEGYGKTYTYLADLHSMPFADKTFNCAFSSMVMQWSQNQEKAFLEAKRVLQKDAKFAFSLVGEGSLFELREVFLACGYNSQIYNFSNQDDILHYAEHAGFTNIEIRVKRHVSYYKDIYHLSKSFKNIGASYKAKNDSNFRSKRYFNKLQEVYSSKFGCDKGLPLRWNIIYITGNA